MKKLLILLVVVPTITFGQVTLAAAEKEIVIRGNVSDMNGMPLTGVAILVKGISKVIKTNFDGNFNLKTKEGALLIVSCPGFKSKEISIGNQIKIDITLEDEVKSETKRALTKSDIRKKRRAEKKAKRQPNYGQNPESLEDWALKAAGRSVIGAIRKNVKN